MIVPLLFLSVVAGGTLAEVNQIHGHCSADRVVNGMIWMWNMTLSMTLTNCSYAHL